MTISFRNTFRDRLAFAAYHLVRHPIMLATAVGFFAFITYINIQEASHHQAPSGSPVVKVIAFIFVQVLIMCVILAFWSIIVILSMISRRNKTLYCERTITLGDAAFYLESQYGKSESNWSVVQRLGRSKNYLFIYLNQQSAIIIPRRAFSNPADWDAFLKFCKQKASV